MWSKVFPVLSIPCETRNLMRKHENIVDGLKMHEK